MAAVSGAAELHRRERPLIRRLGSAFATMAWWAWFLLTSATNARSEMKRISGSGFLTWGD